jgi:hypothetical protein
MQRSVAGFCIACKKLYFTQTAITSVVVYLSARNSSVIKACWKCMQEQKSVNLLGTAELARNVSAAATAAETAASLLCGLMLWLFCYSVRMYCFAWTCRLGQALSHQMTMVPTLARTVIPAASIDTQYHTTSGNDMLHIYHIQNLQVKGENDKVNVKRLPKKPAPPRFGRKLTARQQELASHICVGECKIISVRADAASLPDRRPSALYSCMDTQLGLTPVVMFVCYRCLRSDCGDPTSTAAFPPSARLYKHSTCMGNDLTTAVLFLCDAACAQTAAGSTARPLPSTTPPATTAARSAMHQSAASLAMTQRPAR